MAKSTAILARELEKAIAAHVAEGTSEFPADKAMRRVYERDAADLRKVLELFRAGNFFGAYTAAWKLDSLPRDVIPQALWQVLEKTGKKPGRKMRSRQRT
jgi:hypothetical protein